MLYFIKNCENLILYYNLQCVVLYFATFIHIYIYVCVYIRKVKKVKIIVYRGCDKGKHFVKYCDISLSLGRTFRQKPRENR